MAAQFIEIDDTGTLPWLDSSLTTRGFLGLDGLVLMILEDPAPPNHCWVTLQNGPGFLVPFTYSQIRSKLSNAGLLV